MDSAYLRSIVAAFAARGARHDELSVSRRALIDQARRQRPGNQRHNLLGAYLRSGTILATLPKTKKYLADLCLDILSTMAFVGQPVEKEALAVAPRIARRLAHHGSANSLGEAIKHLLRLNLVIEFETFPGSPKTWQRLGLHRAVMAELRDRYGVPISDAKLSGGFNLSLFASQPVDDYTPEEDMHNELGELIEAMLQAVEDDKKNGLVDPRVSVWLRAAQSVMRSYFTTAALLTHKPPQDAEEETSAPLTEHARRLEHLIRLSEEAASKRSERRVADPHAQIGPEPLFPDDLVWLCNELGVVCLAQGNLYEARRAFERALTINSTHVEYSDRLQNWRRIQLNQVHLDFERAKISRAQSRILEIEQSINEQADALFELTGKVPRLFGATAVDDIIYRFGREELPQTRVVDDKFPADLILATGLLTGYRGLCSHVQGELETAMSYFQDAVSIFRNIGEQRAYALFQRHRAQLLVGIRRRNEANSTMNSCRAAANAAGQMDIAHMAAITQAEHGIATATSDRTPLLPGLKETLRYAARTDMYRVRMEARRVLARVRLAAGDYDGALEHATEAMSLATRFGFSLAKIRLRILIGEILILRGDPKSGTALIERAVRNAERVGYARALEGSRQLRGEHKQPPSN
jgi:tetratricopeptide (TPR) repeat protein